MANCKDCGVKGTKVYCEKCLPVRIRHHKCQRCQKQIPFTNVIALRKKFCKAHDGSVELNCKQCGSLFWRNKGNTSIFCGAECRKDNAFHRYGKGACTVCGQIFQRPTAGSVHCKSCSKVRDSGRTLKVIDCGNRYPPLTIKACESTERHHNCSGMMLVTHTSWKLCSYCANPTAAPASVQYL